MIYLKLLAFIKYIIINILNLAKVISPRIQVTLIKKSKLIFRVKILDGAVLKFYPNLF